mmetsp:Transcript_16267/g.18421  ORF Transcript_16267/g.18421 Transcript_16267/m.18421 type:complete len:617 (-) Transcript_16267:813-2663(-)
MPVISVEKNLLFKTLEVPADFTEKQFDELCFEFGIELDEVLEEEGKEIYKIDLPANRYDLLCLEGLTRALRVFENKEPAPTFTVIKPSADVLAKTELVVKKETSQIRKFVVAAILRDITFDESSYQSFIDLQEHLHRNICRQRTLVSVGTHDLDTIEGPFTYEALPPEEICFKHLFADKEMKGKEMLDWFRTAPEGKHIKPYTDIIYDSPVYPVVKDKNKTVMSLPPIINGSHSKMSVNTKNVFIEATATDLTKAKIVLNTICAMFSRYCAKPETVEAVNVRYEATGEQSLFPDMSTREASADIKEMCSTIGVDIEPEKIVKLCDKMQLGPARLDGKGGVIVTVPVTRSDILHAVDIIEDVAIAYGYNNIPRTIPVSHAPGRELPINQLSDMMRLELGRQGYTELMSLGLCSHDENFAYLNREDDGKSAVKLSNPKTIEFQVVRTSLIPGTLKTLAENRSMKISEGIRLFEVTDVVLMNGEMDKDEADIGCRNERHLVVLYAGPTAGVEIIHGMVDRIMQSLAVVPSPDYCVEASETAGVKRLVANEAEFGQYLVEPEDNPTFFRDMSACLKVKKRGSSEYVKVGSFGALHPSVLSNFKLSFPASIFEMNLEFFKN